MVFLKVYLGLIRKSLKHLVEYFFHENVQKILIKMCACRESHAYIYPVNVFLTLYGLLYKAINSFITLERILY